MTSYDGRMPHGAAVFKASKQVHLFDQQTGMSPRLSIAESAGSNYWMRGGPQLTPLKTSGPNSDVSGGASTG